MKISDPVNCPYCLITIDNLSNTERILESIYEYKLNNFYLMHWTIANSGNVFNYINRNIDLKESLIKSTNKLPWVLIKSSK